MSYQVLARKYRPRSFQEMVGQEHVLRALINALDQNRLHHAYLFTGTRGVGKTTLARIIARCLNCETGITSKPCGQCINCQEIEQGRFIDMIEVDAASRTKVEDTRELLENVQYAPTRGRYKVYLIDEVHMLSGHSFNALLKTLEEPPPHAKFLLATTDPQRLPVTILSRCLQFNLKNLSPEKIKAQLENVLQQEKIPFENNALTQLARAANGSLRDALSLLDQAIAYGADQVKESEVRSMLGTIEQTHILHLLKALANRDAKTILAVIDQLAEHTPDFVNALEELLNTLHQIALLQIIPDSTTEKELIELAQQFAVEDVQLFYQIGLIGRRDLPLAPTPRSGFEMIMLRMLAFQPIESNYEEKPATEKPAIIKTPTTPPTTIAAPIPSAPQPVIIQDWSDIVAQLGLTGLAQMFATNCTLVEHIDGYVKLAVDPTQAALRNPKVEARLGEALSAYFGKPISLQVNIGNANIATPARIQQAENNQRLQTATQILEKDSTVQALMKTFNATILPGSIQAKQSDSLIEPEIS